MARKFFRRLSALGIVLALPACGGESTSGPGAAPPAGPPPPPPIPSSNVSFANHIQPIFSTSCATSGCHSGAGAPEGLDLSAGVAYGNIVNVSSVQSPGTDLVKPGDPGNSYLVLKVEGSVGQRMPPASPLPQTQLDGIRTWVTEGANDN